VFNKDKLDWMNGVYIRGLSPEELVQRAIPFLERDLPTEISRPLDVGYIRQFMPLVQERARTLAEVPQLSDFFFIDELEYDTRLLLSKIDKAEAVKGLQASVVSMDNLKDWSAASLEAVFRPLTEELELKTGVFFGLLRVAVTGRTAAPPLFQTMEVLGKERCLKRLRAALDKLSVFETS
jgi:glutamyl-tRNA synthetase